MVDKKKIYDVFLTRKLRMKKDQVNIGSILMLLDDVSSQDKPQLAVRALEYRFNQR